jgi:hypothetical protein
MAVANPFSLLGLETLVNISRKTKDRLVNVQQKDGLKHLIQQTSRFCPIMIRVSREIGRGARPPKYVSL